MSRRLRCTSFDDVAHELERLERSPSVAVGSGWPLPTVLAHCAQSIEYSIAGYPRLRPAWFRATLGRLARAKFLTQGRMSHDLRAPVPGAPPLVELVAPVALRRLRDAISTFRAHEGPLAPHLAYGPCTRSEYEQLHAMHVADHLSAVRVA